MTIASMTPRPVALAGALLIACGLTASVGAEPADTSPAPEHPADSCCVSDASAELLHRTKGLDNTVDGTLAAAELTAFAPAPEQDGLGLTGYRLAWNNFSQAVPQLVGASQEPTDSLISKPLVRGMIALGALTFLLRFRQR
jgi:hypothetical protein